MKITQIAVATIVPAVVAGAALSAVPFAQAAPVPPAAHAATHRVVRPRAAAKAPGRRAAGRKHHATAGKGSAVQAGNAEIGSLQTQQTASTASDTYTTAGESSFEQCVAWRESSDTPTDPDGLFGILPYIWQSLGYSGTAGQAPVAVQQQAFNRLYAEDGAQPWAPSDGC